MQIPAEEFRDLTAGCNPEILAKFLHVTPRTLQRWREGSASAPYSAYLALNLFLNGEIAGFFGKGWKGFNFGRDGKLYPPLFHGGYPLDS